MTSNPYINEIHAVLPRLLALYDRDSLSLTYGMGDRFRWAWGLIDFGNGTHQGAAHGLARLLDAGLLPAGISEKSILRRIDSMFHGADRLRRPNGSMEEAFPFESSFCVTALVAYDLLSAVETLGSRIDEQTRKRYIAVVRPMIAFLHVADETHGFISNHLATASAALYKWSSLTGEEGEKRGRLFLDRILNGQSPEGWFREYDGADPGYQTLCLYYLADLSKLRPDLGLLEPLRRSMAFLWHFAHPDGSFGGLYGSRNTRFCYPAGIETLANEIEECRAMSRFLRKSIREKTTVTLSTMDDPNLVPMFNAYCMAAVRANADDGKATAPTLPALVEGSWRRDFKDAGLVVEKRPDSYTIISYRKGGVIQHYGSKSFVDAGVVARDSGGQLYSTQAAALENIVEMDGDKITVTAPFTAVNKRLPSPFQFMILRLLNITVMRSLTLGNIVKTLLVRMLITGKKSIGVKNRRTITLGGTPSITDEWAGDSGGLTRVEAGSDFTAIHMASKGYWQIQDDRG